MTQSELEFLYNLVQDSSSAAVVVELGAWKGRSTAALYTAMCGDQAVVTVDTWLGQPDLRFEQHREVLEKDLFLEFLDNMKEFGVYPTWYELGNIGANYLRMDSVDAAALFENQSVDVLFIDCDHNRVGLDIDAWREKVKPNGVICGHDYSWVGVKDVVLSRLFISQVVGDIWVGGI